MKWSSFKYLVKQGWHSMVANRLMTLASIGVLVACLMITGVAALLSVNVTSYVDYLETLNEIVFFIDDAAPAETVEALKTQIPADGNVAACEYVPKAAAVEEMREYLGDYGDIMNDYAGEGNTENPLPASFRVSVTDVADLAPTVERIKAMGAYTATAEDGTGQRCERVLQSEFALRAFQYIGEPEAHRQLHRLGPCGRAGRGERGGHQQHHPPDGICPPPRRSIS